MHFALFSAISLLIVIIDYRTHRIPNRLSTLFFCTSLLDTHLTTPIEIFTALIVMLVLFLVARIGAGDIKLAAAMIVTQGQLVLTSDYLSHMALVLLGTFLLFLATRRSLKGSVAFSQVLLIPFMLSYLAI